MTTEAHCRGWLSASEMTTGANAGHQHYISHQGGTSVAKLKKEDTLVPGNTAAWEYGFGMPIRKSYCQPSHNPLNFASDAGGSSSGTGSPDRGRYVYADRGGARVVLFAGRPGAVSLSA